MRTVPVEQTQGMNWPILQPVNGDQANGDGEAHGVALTKPVCIAGSRQGRVHLPLTAPTVSRAHALFVWGEHGVWLHDLASRNHLYVNDQPVRHTLLGDGDVVRIGPNSFTCQSGFGRADGANGRAMPAALITTHDQMTIPMSGPAVVIGSRENCDIVLPDDKVEQVHAVIYELDGRRLIRDLGSCTGTFVNDRPVGQVGLEAGDRIRIGAVEFKYDEGEQFAASEAQTQAPTEAVPVETTEAVPAEVADAAPAQVTESESQVERDEPGAIPLQEEPEQHAGSVPAPQAAADQSAKEPTPAAESASAPAAEPLDDIIPLLDDPLLADPPAAPAAKATESAPSPSPAPEPDDAIPLREDPQDESDSASKLPAEPPKKAARPRPATSHPGAAKKSESEKEDDPFDQLLNELEEGGDAADSPPGKRSAEKRKTDPAGPRNDRARVK